MASKKNETPAKGGKAKGGKPAKGEKQGKTSKKGKGGGKKKKPAERKIYKRETPPRLRTKYESEVTSKLMEEFSFGSPMQVPRLVKVTLNMGLGAANQNPKLLESGVEELRTIAGQAPVVTIAKRDIATFKLRKGHKIGTMVTLRRERMWEFLDRFINVALPRVRDFKGVSPKAFDGRGNYSLGIREQLVFPEIEYDAIDSVKGLNVTIVTTARNDAEGRALLKHLGMPFRQPAAAALAQGAQA
jgi:large subunit ribosomal protein L5